MLNAELISKVWNVKWFNGNKTDYLLIDLLRYKTEHLWLLLFMRCQYLNICKVWIVSHLPQTLNIILFLNVHFSGQGVAMNTSQSQRITMFFISPVLKKNKERKKRKEKREGEKKNFQRFGILKPVNKICGADKILNGTMQLKLNSIWAHPVHLSERNKSREAALLLKPCSC